MREAQRRSVVVEPHYFIYFVRAEGSDHVKVGFSTDVTARMTNLQTANAYRLVLEFCFPTSTHRETEAQLHQYLTSLGRHVRGEWFRLENGIDYFDLLDEFRRSRRNDE